ncbi:hypothetical protein [Sphingomonas sp. RS2018]
MSTVTPGMSTLAQAYGFAGNAAQFAIGHIETLKQADNVLANRCGQVLEAATSGFGVGQETAMLLIGVGQSLLGNPLTGKVIIGTGNPIVMTCAAIGAIHYGWKAMNDDDRTALLSTVGAAFDVGIEFLKAIGNFAFDLIQALMSRENFEELKRIVSSVAQGFGRHLSDITRLLSDRFKEGAQIVYSAAGGAAATAWSYIPAIRTSEDVRSLGVNKKDD